MTLFLIDLARYQEGIDLTKVQAAGFNYVNIKLTQGNWYSWTNGKTYAEKARQLGMGISTFSWIDNSVSGATQAQYAYNQLLKTVGTDKGFAHQCDCEDNSKPPSFQIWSDYVKWWQDKLGRHIVNYTGDWWWSPRKWNGASLTPYLRAAPNNGYLASYPGDTSTAWHAGYGGWNDYAALQYSVSTIAGAGGGNLSKSAIRDHNVWGALTGASTIKPTLTSTRIEDTMWQGKVAEGSETTMVMTPWNKSVLSVGCTKGSAKLRIAEHEVNGPWKITEITITDNDAHRTDLPADSYDRRDISRIPIDANDKLTTPVGWLAWLS